MKGNLDRADVKKENVYKENDKEMSVEKKENVKKSLKKNY